MARFLKLLLCIVIVAFVAAAFIRGWVGISTFTKEEANESGATLTIHKSKVQEDWAAAQEALSNLGHQDTPEPKAENSSSSEPR